jgi:hypothetical protein
MARLVGDAGIGFRLGDHDRGVLPVNVRAEDLTEQIAANGGYIVAEVE